MVTQARETHENAHEGVKIKPYERQPSFKNLIGSPPERHKPIPSTGLRHWVKNRERQSSSQGDSTSKRCYIVWGPGSPSSTGQVSSPHNTHDLVECGRFADGKGPSEALEGHGEHGCSLSVSRRSCDVCRTSSTFPSGFYPEPELGRVV